MFGTGVIVPCQAILQPHGDYTTQPNPIPQRHLHIHLLTHRLRYPNQLHIMAQEDNKHDGEENVYEWREGCDKCIERRSGPGADVSRL
jgi:hypothetical protein